MNILDDREGEGYNSTDERFSKHEILFLSCSLKELKRAINADRRRRGQDEFIEDDELPARLRLAVAEAEEAKRKAREIPWRKVWHPTPTHMYPRTAPAVVKQPPMEEFSFDYVDHATAVGLIKLAEEDVKIPAFRIVTYTKLQRLKVIARSEVIERLRLILAAEQEGETNEYE
jgi:hypothetical protein